LLQVSLPLRDSVGADLRRHTDQLVNTLMGKKAELRFCYIRDHAEDALANLDV
jgi:DNA gyrase/topoisomerase IV subunit B